MIRLIEASNFRSLKYISQPLSAFHVLIGANATGKTTFLDVVKFMADIVNDGIDKAVFARVAFFDELTFGGKGGDIELAIEVELPATIKGKLESREYDRIRFELRVGTLPENREIAIKDERVTLFRSVNGSPKMAGSIFDEKVWPDQKLVASKRITGIATMSAELNEVSANAGAYFQFNLGVKKSAIANIPEDETKFPATLWLKSFLQSSIQPFVLDSLNMRNPSAPGQSTEFKPDGSNLPWVVEQLKKDEKKFILWTEHVQTALPDVEDIYTVVREEDRKRYLKIRYRSGVEVPSWLVSDGTLSLLALTIPAYLKDLNGVFLIEEPENGIHPKAIEAVFQSLSSVYDAQILLATHSPVVLGLTKPEELLCFSKDADGATAIINGTNHPKLKDWKGSPNLNVLFASGILS